MVALQHFLRQPMAACRRCARARELRVDASSRLTAEQVREVHGAPAGRGSLLRSHCARAHVAAMANSSAPTSTSRTAQPGGTRAWAKRIIAWNTPRARRRAARST